MVRGVQAEDDGAELPGSGGGAFPDYGGLAKPAEGEL